MVEIKNVSQRTGLNAKTIRYYEDIGLVKIDRAANGYRDYSVDDIHRLTFIQRSKSLGFSIDECRHLLSLYEDKSRASADVKKMANDKIAMIDHKIAELNALRDTLSHLAKNCQGNDRPDCPIIDELAGAAKAPMGVK